MQCTKPGGVPYYPGIFSGPCQLMFYNPDYTFPRNFDECQQRGGHLSATYTRARACSVTVTLPPFYDSPNKAVYDTDVGARLMNDCQARGGFFEMVVGEYPECRATFLDVPDTQQDCEAAFGKWQPLPDGTFRCVI